MEKRKLFVSYSRADTEYVSKLVKSLRKVGFDVWFDKNIRTGDEWDDVIEQEIKNSDAMVLILSKSSVNSNNVKDEMSYAMQLNKGIHPVKIEECDVPMRLARKQYTDFTQTGYDQGMNKLVDDIKHKLGGFGKTESPPKPNLDPKAKSKLPLFIIIGLVVVVVVVLINFVPNVAKSQLNKNEVPERLAEDTIENPPTEMEKDPFEDLNNSIEPKKFVWYPSWEPDLYRSLNYSQLSTVAYFSYELDPKTGDSITVYDWLTTPLVDSVKNNNKKILLTVSNLGKQNNSMFLKNFAAGDTLIKRIISMLDARKANGVCIDFQGIVNSQKRNYNIFITLLGQELKKQNKDYLVYLAVPAVDWNKYIDYDILIPVVDHFVITGVIDSVTKSGYRPIYYYKYADNIVPYKANSDSL